MKKLEKKQMILLVLETELKETKKAHEQATDELWEAFKTIDCNSVKYRKLAEKVNELYGRYKEVKYIYDMIVKEC